MSQIQGFDTEAASVKKPFIRVYLEQILDYMKTPESIYNYNRLIDEFGNERDAFESFATRFICNVYLKEIQDDDHYRFVSLDFNELLQKGQKANYSTLINIINSLLQESDENLVRTLLSSDFPNVEISPEELKWKIHSPIAIPTVGDGIDVEAVVTGNTYKEMKLNLLKLETDIINQIGSQLQSIGETASIYFAEGNYEKILECYESSGAIVLPEVNTENIKMPEVQTMLTLISGLNLNYSLLKDAIEYIGLSGGTSTWGLLSTYQIADTLYNMTHCPNNLIHLISEPPTLTNL